MQFAFISQTDSSIIFEWQGANGAVWCRRMSATITHATCKKNQRRSKQLFGDLRCEGCGGLDNQDYTQPERQPLTLVWDAEKEPDGLTTTGDDDDVDEFDGDDNREGTCQYDEEEIEDLLADLFPVFDAKSGKFKGITHTLDEVRTKFGAIANDRNKLILFEKIFGDEGKRFAQIITQSKQNFQDFDSFVNSHKDITQKQEIWAQGFNASWIKLVTTIKSTGASLFDPMLEPLTHTNDLVNNITGKLGEFAEEHKGFAKTVSYGAGAAVAGTGLYALYNLLMGAKYGQQVLSGLRGMGGTALGVTEGKVLQEATGVQPVFVTNFPATPPIPVVGGLVPTSIMLAPALLAAIVGAISIALGKGKTDDEVKYLSTARLQELRKQHMVRGGGENSYQVQAIDRELAERRVRPEGAGSWGRAIPLMSSHQTFEESYGMLSSHHRSNPGLDERALRDIKNNINLEIHIDSQARTFTRVDGKNTHITTLRRGDFFGEMATH